MFPVELNSDEFIESYYGDLEVKKEPKKVEVKKPNNKKVQNQEVFNEMINHYILGIVNENGREYYLNLQNNLTT